MKIHQEGAELFHAVGQTRHDEVNSPFFQFCERACKGLSQ
jgi:hypothetical protein